MKIEKKFTHNFNKRKFHCYVGPLYGTTSTSERTILELIVVAQDLNERDLVRVAIHEALHACNPDLTEDQVKVYAKDIESFLTKIGIKFTIKKTRSKK